MFKDHNERPRKLTAGSDWHNNVHDKLQKYNSKQITNKQTPWPESASELYLPSDRSLSAKLVPSFADRGESRSQRDWSPTAVISVKYNSKNKKIIQLLYWV
jgi:hypothetical protein